MSTIKKSLAALVAASSVASAAPAAAETSRLQISPEITVRRLVVNPPAPKGTILLLHGFPETAHTWDEIATQLGSDYEVHAFDWPGYGQSSRPPAEKFAYAPRDYAQVVKDYIRAAGIDKSQLVIYATDIGALPPLLLALDDPGIARKIIVGDFAPLDRPHYMAERLRMLKAPATAAATRAAINQGSSEIIANAFHRGLDASEQFAISPAFTADMLAGWNHGPISSGDAFYHYYSHFTRDQQYLEANLARLTAPVTVVWGERDIYIDKKMGEEFSASSGKPLTILPKLGHYPHLQAPQQTIAEIRAAITSAPPQR
ncbi:alpha/beta fold hydrolase [Pseudoduganella sp. OTU4001]|uniref:alpha/beta fold hydrolase n=1 Tax=Pseudoduganella sp. OTU4001 TaxID=3043854 RepID=UPI00313AE529